jgi:hypothetical protein
VLGNDGAGVWLESRGANQATAKISNPSAAAKRRAVRAIESLHP